MKRTANNSLQFIKRKPYEPVKELFQVPVALYEVLSLVEDAEQKGQDVAKLKALVESIIETALFDSEAWLKVQSLAENGYRFVRVDTEILKSSEAG